MTFRIKKNKILGIFICIGMFTTCYRLCNFYYINELKYVFHKVLEIIPVYRFVDLTKGGKVAVQVKMQRCHIYAMLLRINLWWGNRAQMCVIWFQFVQVFTFIHKLSLTYIYYVIHEYIQFDLNTFWKRYDKWNWIYRISNQLTNNNQTLDIVLKIRGI